MSVAISTDPLSKMDRSLIEPLEFADAGVYTLLCKEKDQQRDSLDMIASDNATSLAVLQALGSSTHNRYCDGYPGKRFV